MTERREFNASTVDDALERAAAAFGISRHDLNYEILDGGSSGFLGLGARDARVTVEVPEAGDDHHLYEEGPKAVEEEPPLQGSEKESQGDHSADESDSVAQQGPDHPAEPADSHEQEAQEEVSEELLAEVRDHVENVLDAMAFDSEVGIRDDGEVLMVSIESADAGLLIGQKGETLDAIQYLTNVAVHRNHQHAKRVVLDCEGYRDRRVKAVQGMAHRTAKRVAKEGRAVDLPPMSSSERRAVHSYLKDNPWVTTSSSGNDENRRITITPTRNQ